MNRTQTATFGLWVAGLGFLFMLSGGVFNAIAIMPNWYANQPEGFFLMRDLFEGGPTNMRTFFIPVALCTLAGSVLAVGAGWRERRRRSTLFAAGAFLAVMIVSLGFLLPLDLQLFSEPGTSDPGELESAADRYVALHVLRLLFMAAGAATALRAATSQEASAARKAETLSYAARTSS